VFHARHPDLVEGFTTSAASLSESSITPAAPTAPTAASAPPPPGTAPLPASAAAAIKEEMVQFWEMLSSSVGRDDSLADGGRRIDLIGCRCGVVRVGKSRKRRRAE